MQVDRFGPTPLYQQVAQESRDRIRAAELKPREPIPSESDLVANHGAARETARRAVALLRDEGRPSRCPSAGHP
ncbi:GntR family transcriptional regulator [Streptomonospora algeriensis]|uniref:GntR family transcriptional regulator n=1 Tax=Streptomonospora algeriensis TaxID=995084 RepID=A0ABW3BHB3_9ACTN